MPSTKALTDPKKPKLVAVSKIVLRATQIKEYAEEHGMKSMTSREARRYLAGVEGVERNRPRYAPGPEKSKEDATGVRA